MPNSTLEISDEIGKPNSETIASYQLKNGEICYIQKLKDTHLEQSLELQKKILNDLGPERQLYITAKTKEEFSKLRDGEHGITLGAFVKDGVQYKLIGQQILILHKDPHHMPVGTLEINGLTAEFGGDLVAPEYRGNKLSIKMKTLLEKIITAKEITFLTGEIHIGNIVNQVLFSNFGFICGNAVIDPNDEAPVLYFFKPKKPVQLNHKDKHQLIGNNMTIEQVKELTKDGYYGKKWKYDSKTEQVTISFYKHKIS